MCLFIFLRNNKHDNTNTLKIILFANSNSSLYQENYLMLIVDTNQNRFF